MNDVINAIYTKLNSITGLAGNVFKYNKGSFEKYPVAVILGGEISKERESTKCLRKTYKVRARILQEIKSDNTGVESGEAKIMSLADTIETAFDNDDTLGGAVDDIEVSSAFGWEDREILMRGIDIDINCVKLVQLG